MRILLVAVGRARHDPATQIFDYYRHRLDERGIGRLSLKEVEEKRPLPAPERKLKEGELLLRAVPKGALVVALDVAGKPLSSWEFARKLGAWRDAGTADLAFLVGGADGLSQAVLEHADLVLSLGPMTWPHLLVRGMLAEQLYRAQTILAGHPYHRD